MFFKPRRLPVGDEVRHWVEAQGELVFEVFGQSYLLEKPFVLPNEKFWEPEFRSTPKDGNRIAYKLAKIMDIPHQCFELRFIDDDELLLDSSLTPNQNAAGMFNISNPEASYHTGIYNSFEEKYSIKIKKTFLKYPMALVAVIAHEFSHIKLLGEKGMYKNDEYLTDLLPVFFGLGIFCSHAVSPDTEPGKIGYLTPSIYGYAMALWTLKKNMDCDTICQFLTGTVRHIFRKSIKYIRAKGYIFWNSKEFIVNKKLQNFLDKLQ